ncbi:hypothetical protein AB1Y20_010426 [Prymnesium parvum]|uniref:phosphoethanolamine N-methyltransferase n=1 Tax=Prymnesium parvum TaxID=97485 RepID=A0AB34IRG6_PRYPA
MASSQCYRDAPILLNLERREDASFHLASTWCNLGLWPRETFAEACRELALQLGRAVGLHASDVVLDVGVGYGDQCALWASEFGVDRVIAVELSAPLAAAAAARLQHLERSEVHTASATELPPPVVAAASGCDVVLCLDCAYHFDTRRHFVRHAAELLRRGGRFGAVDMLPCDVGWGWRWVAQRVVAAACNIPRANLCGVEEYRETLHRAGLEVTALTSLSARVFAPFAANATRQRRRLAGQLRWPEWVFLCSISFIMDRIARHRLFDAILVTAEKR